MKERDDRTKGGITVLVPETETERRVLVRLIKDAIGDREFPVFDYATQDPEAAIRSAHFYLFDSEPPVEGWFKAVIDVNRYLMDDDFLAFRQIPGVLGVVLDGRGYPEATFFADEKNGMATWRGSLNPVLALADFTATPAAS